MGSYLKVCAKKFALYIHENNHLRGYSISKDEARRIFVEDFQKQFKVKVNFCSLFFHSLKLLERPKDVNVMTYNEQKLLKLYENVAGINQEFEKGVSAKKKTLVSQSFAFKSTTNNENGHSKTECLLCGVSLKNQKDLHDHQTTGNHVFMERFNKALNPPKVRKKCPLQFTVDNSPILDNIIVRQGLPTVVNFTVKNVSKQVYEITTIETSNDINGVVFKPDTPMRIAPATAIQYVLTVSYTGKGILFFPILINATADKGEEIFAVELVFHAHNESFDDLHPKEPFKPRSKAIVKEFIEYVDEGERPSIVTPVTVKVSLKPYKLVADLTLLLNTGLKPFSGMTRAQEIRLTDIKNLLDVEDKLHCLQPSNYPDFLDLLLYLEEHQANKNIRDYDLENHELKIVPKSNYLELKVADLIEGRPSLVIGDMVHVREAKDHGVIFTGYVHKVQESSVLLKFSSHFIENVFVAKKLFYISFSLNRYPMKVAHQAVEFVRITNVSHLLFPKTIHQRLDPNVPIKWYNRDIENNAEQQQAVKAVLQRTAIPAPYLIFGPPGTGKTMTVVECIKQIYKGGDHNVLVCTPSNNAANEIARRLVGFVSKADLFRYLAISFPHELIPREIKNYTNYKNGVFYQPPMDELVKFRVLITTLTTAAKLLNGGCPEKHFGYVFVDESGQATEVETLIPIAGILSSQNNPGSFSGQIVLAGDPKQLGPIIFSTLALEYGFGTSMLERLMETCTPYQKDPVLHRFDPNMLTKLVQNYRSHPVIIRQPNELFYDNELVSAGDDSINIAINSDVLLNPVFPLIFHSTIGMEQRERNSPSFFNIQEVEVILHYLERLIGSKMQGVQIREEHIAVITPYKKQVEKTRQVCVKKGFKVDRLMIGTVEQIQGQERLIVILSSVRSRPNFAKLGNKSGLGFLRNPKRFNVAITRAKALLVVVGNPNLLQRDHHWKPLIRYCLDNWSVVGEKFELAEEQVQEDTDVSNEI